MNGVTHVCDRSTTVLNAHLTMIFLKISYLRSLGRHLKLYHYLTRLFILSHHSSPVPDIGISLQPLSALVQLLASPVSIFTHSQQTSLVLAIKHLHPLSAQLYLLTSPTFLFTPSHHAPITRQITHIPPHHFLA